MDESPDVKKPIQLSIKNRRDVIDMDLLLFEDGRALLVNEELGITSTLPRAFFSHPLPERRHKTPTNVISFAKHKVRRELEQELRAYEKDMGDYIHAP